MPVKTLVDYLDKNNVEYTKIQHTPEYTALEIAESAHVPGDELAKTVMIKIDGKMAMAVVPASRHVDLEQLRSAAGGKRIELAEEREFESLFPACEVGAMPPFGNLFDMDVYSSEELRKDEEIAFCAGSHDELVQMSYADFERLVSPHVVHLTA